MKHIILYCTLIALMASIMSAQADWNETGFPLEDHLASMGTVNGGVYVGGGHGKSSASDYHHTPNSLPPGGVAFARLYTGGMFCSKTGATWFNVTLNGESLGNLTIEGLSDTNPNAYIYPSGNGVLMALHTSNRMI